MADLKRIIPCLDVKDGRVVKGVNFVDFKDAGDPVEFAEFYERSGADALVFLDITATVEGRKTKTELAAKIAKKIKIPFAIGGGIASVADAEAVLAAGADRISVNTAAVIRPELVNEIARKFGSEKLTVAIDAKRTGSDGYTVLINGGAKDAGVDAVKWAAEAEKRGASEILLTSLDRDGTLDGYDIEMTRSLADAVKIPVIASGGAGKLTDFYDALTEGRAEAALSASLFHFRTFSIGEVKKYLRERGVNVNV